MTTRRLLFIIPVATLLLAPIVLFLVDRVLTVCPAPETQTQFLRAYTPNRVFDRFRDSNYSISTGSSVGHCAGIGFATHKKLIDQQLIMRSAERTVLMAALDQDVTSSLTDTGAKVISETSNDTEGIRVSYVAGKSSGTVTIKPPDPVQHSSPSLGPGEVDVRVRIGIEETWSKLGNSMSPAKLPVL